MNKERRRFLTFLLFIPLIPLLFTREGKAVGGIVEKPEEIFKSFNNSTSLLKERDICIRDGKYRIKVNCDEIKCINVEETAGEVGKEINKIFAQRYKTGLSNMKPRGII